MMTIWKFPFKLSDVALVSMPKGAKLLSVAPSDNLVHGDLCCWALVDSEAPRGTRELRVYGTGHDCRNRPEDYVGTVHLGVFVWHVFDGGEAP